MQRLYTAMNYKFISWFSNARKPL